MGRKRNRKIKKTVIKRIIGTASLIGILGLTVYCMFNGLGLVDELDFGAGAYYYADIPQFAKYVNGDHFTSQFPMWFHVVLFLIWGALMYRLWIWLDKKWKQ